MSNLNVSGQFKAASVSSLKGNQIFVFGSNTEGRHGEGAAKDAIKFGAIQGQARGLMGQSYGIVTKDLNKGTRSIPLESIAAEVKELLAFANSKPNKEFIVTPIGVGLAGYTVQEIAPMFQGAPENVVLPKEFLENLVPFLAPSEIKSLVSVLEEDWATLSLTNQILLANEMAIEMSGDKISPLIVKTRNGQLVGPHVTNLSKLSSFTQMLSVHSGQGFSTLERVGIQHPAVLTFEVTIGELRLDEDLPEKVTKELRNEILSKKIAQAKKTLVLRHGKPEASQPYKLGETLAEGEMLYHLNYHSVVDGKVVDSRLVAGPKLNKPGFQFVVEAVPTLEDTDFILVGNPEGATRAKVQVRIKGHWYSTSEAEKFAAQLTKLCIDKMPETNTPEDLLKGGILLYEDDTTLPLEEMALQILEGKRVACPLTDVGSGQETQKGAPTAEPAAAFLKALTGKSVLREETLRHQKVNDEDVEMGYVVWDTDEFVEFRHVWNESSIHPCVWVRWIDELMQPIFVEATKKEAQNYYYFPCLHGGYFWFHRTEVRVEIAPLTLETATQKECLATKPKGSMFSELVQTLAQLSPELAVLAKLLYATSHNDRIVAELVPMLWNVPTPDEIVGPQWKGLEVFYPARPSTAEGWQCDRPNPEEAFPVDPQEMFRHMSEQFGNCFVLCQGGDDSEAIIVSPLLAQHLGAAPGGQLNLYAAVVYQLGMLLQSPYPPEDAVWGAEWKQWWASHKTAVLDCMIGGEIQREQAKAGLLAATSRGKGVYAAKIGGCTFSVEDVHGVRHTAQPGELYVSTSNPLAKLDGNTAIPWRNPMPFLDGLTIKAIGPSTKYCKKPSIEFEEGILPDSKIFAHPIQVSKTAGDTDGDGWQFLVIEKLLEWAMDPRNKAAIDAVPGLWEGLLEFFLEVEEEIKRQEAQ